MRRHRGILLPLWIGATVALLAGLAGDTAGAHGGRPVFAGVAGPYYIQAFALDLSAEQGSLMDYSLSIRGANDRRPIDNATALVGAKTPDGEIAPRKATAFANVHSVYLPVQKSGEWTMNVSIDGPLGPASLEHTLTPLGVPTFTVNEDATSNSSTPALLALAALGIIGVPIGAFVVLYTRRKQRAVGPD